MAKVTSSEHLYIATTSSRKESCHLNLPHRLGKPPRAVSPSGTLTAPEAGEMTSSPLRIWMSSHHPQSQTTQHWQTGNRCRHSSSEAMRTAKPGESSLSFLHFITGLGLSSVAHAVTGRLTFLEKQEGPILPSYRSKLCMPIWQLWVAKCLSEVTTPYFPWMWPWQVLPSSSAPCSDGRRNENQ